MEDGLYALQMLSFLGGFIFIFAILGAVMYVANGLSLYTMAQRHKIEAAWFAWVPIANCYLMGNLVDNDVHPSLKGKTGIALVAAVVLAGLFQVFGLLSMVFYYYVLYFLLKKYTTKYVECLIASILTGGLATPFILFAIRNNNLVEVEVEVEVEELNSSVDLSKTKSTDRDTDDYRFDLDDSSSFDSDSSSSDSGSSDGGSSD